VHFLGPILLNDIGLVGLVRGQRNQQDIVELDVKAPAELTTDLALPLFAVRALAMEPTVTKRPQDYPVRLHFVLQHKFRIVQALLIPPLLRHRRVFLRLPSFVALFRATKVIRMRIRSFFQSRCTCMK
jgi:hypothetical protein